MKAKKDTTNHKDKSDGKAGRSSAVARPEVTDEFASKADLKTYLLNIRDKIEEENAAPIYAMTALNRVLANSRVYQLLDSENKELARDIWLRLKQAGMQLRNPPILFGDETAGNPVL